MLMGFSYSTAMHRQGSSTHEGTSEEEKSVLPANSLQNFSASSEEKWPLRKNSKFQFLKEFGLKKNNFIVRVSGKISFSSLVLVWKREGIHFLKFGPFSALFVKIGQNSAAVRHGHSTVLFIRPSLTYRAEQSASCNTGKTNGYVVEYPRTYRLNWS